MNIKKSPLMAGLLALSAVFGSMSGKADEKGYTITREDTDAIFNQTELASVSTSNVVVAIRSGWSYSEESYNYTTYQLETNTWTAPFTVHSPDRAYGFTGAFRNFELPTVSLVAINEDNGKIYAFKSGENEDFYQLNIGSITAKEPLQALSQLNASVTTLGFHSNSNTNSTRQSTAVERAIAWTSGSDEYILTYDVDGGKNAKTKIWHRNGVVNRQGSFDGTAPIQVIRGQNVIYYGNDAKLVYISKSNPLEGEHGVSLISGRVGLGVVGDTLYQAKSDGVYKAGVKLGINKVVIDDGDAVLVPLASGVEVSHMTMTYDRTKLVIACNPTEDKAVKDYQLSDSTPVIAVKGATKIEARSNGIFAMIKNQMVRVHD